MHPEFLQWESPQGMGGYWTLVALTVVLLLPGVGARFINFKPGYEYVYSFKGHSTVNDVGKFIVHAKVSLPHYSNFLSGLLVTYVFHSISNDEMVIWKLVFWISRGFFLFLFYFPIDNWFLEKGYFTLQLSSTPFQYHDCSCK